MKAKAAGQGRHVEMVNNSMENVPELLPGQHPFCYREFELEARACISTTDDANTRTHTVIVSSLRMMSTVLDSGRSGVSGFIIKWMAAPEAYLFESDLHYLFAHLRPTLDNVDGESSEIPVMIRKAKRKNQ
jgi:hypothetical protein